MADENVRLYYYDGDWRPYDYLHEYYGITLVPATPLVVYDDALHEFNAWVEQGTGYIWVVQDNQWYPPEELPYWIKLDTKYKVYLIDEPILLDTYRRRGTELYYYKGNLQPFSYMHNGFGITITPSRIYLVQDGIIKCWFNPDIDDLPYWDVDTSMWLAEPPSHGGSGGIDDVGSTGTFLFNSMSGLPTHYGALVSGDRLLPMCLNMPDSGELSCTKFSTVQVTGTWKILTETGRSSDDNRCIVTAIKVSDDSSYSNDNNNNTDNNDNTGNNDNNNSTDIIEYDL